MNNQNQYSDEYISAYIDGELDTDDCACILFDEQEDVELAQRVNDARMLKEKVQLSYADALDKYVIERPFSCAKFVNRHRSLVAGLFIVGVISIMLAYNLSANSGIAMAKQLIASTQPISADRIVCAVGVNKRVVIHVSQYQQNQFGETLNTIESLLQHKSEDESFILELVANGQGLKVLDMASSIYAQRLSDLALRFGGLKVIACAKSLADLASDGNPVQLMTSIIVTPSAAQQIAKRTDNGWLYIKV